MFGAPRIGCATSFGYENEPVASVFRVVDDEGDPILQQGPAGNYEMVSAAWLVFQFAVAATTLLLLISVLLFALACTVALLYLWSNGLIGLRTWAY